MKHQKDEEDSHNFDISPADERPFLPVESKFSIRNNWIVMFILLNCLSLFVLIFLGTGGRPIDAIKRYFKSVEVAKPVDIKVEPQEISSDYDKDYESIKPIIRRLFGQETPFRLLKHSERSKAEIQKSHHALGRIGGNAFIQIDDNFYYLSADGQRLYSCVISGQSKPRQTAAAKPKPQAVRNAEKPAMVEEMYQDQNGVWRNHFVEVPREEFYRDKDGVWRNNVMYTSPPASKKDNSLKEKQDEMKMKEAAANSQRATEIRQQLDRNRPMGDLSSFERFDPSEYKEE